MNVHDIDLDDAWRSFIDSRIGGKLDRVVLQMSLQTMHLNLTQPGLGFNPFLSHCISFECVLYHGGRSGMFLLQADVLKRTKHEAQAIVTINKILPMPAHGGSALAATSTAKKSE